MRERVCYTTITKRGKRVIMRLKTAGSQVDSPAAEEQGKVERPQGGPGGRMQGCLLSGPDERVSTDVLKTCKK